MSAPSARSARDLLQRLAGVAPVLLVALAVAAAGDLRRRPRRGTGRRGPRRTWPRRRGSRRRSWPVAVERVADGADLAVHHPARGDDVGAGVGLGDARPGRRARGWRRCRPRRRRSSDAAVAVVGVLVEAEVGHEHESSPTSSRRSRSATCTMPSGSQASEPVGVLVRRDAEQDHRRARRGRPARATSLRSDSPGVLDDAGQRGDRLRLVDALPHEQRGDQVVDREAGLGHEPAQGRRAAQPAEAALGERHGGDARTWRAPRFRPARLPGPPPPRRATPG